MLDIKTQKRIRRHARIRAKVFGTAKKPRLAVYKSNMQISAQVIDDEKGVTITSINDAKVKGKTKTQRAENAGIEIAKTLKEKGIDSIVFDKGGFMYTGRIKSFADGVRSVGLKF